MWRDEPALDHEGPHFLDGAVRAHLFKMLHALLSRPRCTHMRQRLVNSRSWGEFHRFVGELDELRCEEDLARASESGAGASQGGSWYRRHWARSYQTPPVFD